MVLCLDGNDIGMVLSDGGGGSGGGARPAPKAKGKQKRPPQRGLGVAQLEKIRLEEQQKSAGAVAGRGGVNPNPLFRSPIPVPVPSGRAHAAEGSNMGLTASIPVFLPVMWGGTAPDPAAAAVREADCVVRKFACRPPVTSDTSSSSSLYQRRQPEFHALTVNKTLSPSSSGVDLQMEPPSNQSYCSNYLTLPSSGPEEERMVGMKRPCPFRLENAPNFASYTYKLPPFNGSFIRPDRNVLICGNEAIKLDSRNPISSECITNVNVGTYQADWKHTDPHVDKSKKENDAHTAGDFLSLGPSITPSLAKSKQNHCGNSELNLLPHRESVDDDDASNLGCPAPPLPYYTFLPIGTSPQDTILGEGRVESMEGLDLNLKL